MVINVFQPSLGESELAAIRGVFEVNWPGAGPQLEKFCSEFGRLIGIDKDQLTTVSCCTEGLFQAVEALGLKSGDEVILPSVSFVGAGHAILASGATPVLCDVDPRTLNPSEEMIQQAIGPRTKAIIVLHYGGHPGRIEEIAALAQSRSLFLIEDAACAIGARSGSRMCGTFGDIGVWSFDAMKILVTGDGGIVRATDPSVLDRVNRGTFLGIDVSGLSKSKRQSKWWELDPTEFGRRARMNDITAAIGLVQLERLEAFLQRRHEIAALYNAGLADLTWLVPPPYPEPNKTTSWYFYWIQMRARDRDLLARHLLARGIYSTFRYWPLHRMRLYKSSSGFQGSDYAAARTLLLPIHQGMSNADVEQVIDAVRCFQGSARSRCNTSSKSVQ